MMRNARMLAIGAMVLGFGLGAQAGPAMFSASMILHVWGNDVTTGTVFPYNESGFTAVPLGHDCQVAAPYTLNGAPEPRYCATTTMLQGKPATGSGYLVTGGATIGVPIGLPQSAVSVTATGFLPTYYPYIQTHTYADFRNAAGNFFAGGGPAAGKGTATYSGMGQRSGQWNIKEGKNGYGGVMGLLGKFGSLSTKFIIPGKVGTYEGANTWIIVQALGRPQYATPIGYTPMGETRWQNPHTLSLVYVNNVNGNLSTTQGRVIGTPWTTGTVTVYAKAGGFETILHTDGFDTTTGTGITRVRNIQLVTPELIHWIGPGWQAHQGGVGILTMQITPEPGAILLLAAGGGVLLLLYRKSHRS